MTYNGSRSAYSCFCLFMALLLRALQGVESQGSDGLIHGMFTSMIHFFTRSMWTVTKHACLHVCSGASKISESTTQQCQRLFTDVILLLLFLIISYYMLASCCIPPYASPSISFHVALDLYMQHAMANLQVAPFPHMFPHGCARFLRSIRWVGYYLRRNMWSFLCTIPVTTSRTQYLKLPCYLLYVCSCAGRSNVVTLLGFGRHARALITECRKMQVAITIIASATAKDTYGYVCCCCCLIRSFVAMPKLTALLLLLHSNCCGAEWQ